MNQFFANYKVGQGGFGVVYSAVLQGVEGQEDQYYAVKVIRKDRLAANQAIHVCLIEYQVQFKFNHPIICPMNYFFQTKARFYFIFPLLHGGNLEELLKIKEKFPESQIKFYVT